MSDLRWAAPLPRVWLRLKKSGTSTLHGLCQSISLREKFYCTFNMMKLISKLFCNVFGINSIKTYISHDCCIHCCVFLPNVVPCILILSAWNKVDKKTWKKGLLSFYLCSINVCLGFLEDSYLLFVVIVNINVIPVTLVLFTTIKNKSLIYHK